jgi:hypothetical protein
MCGAVPPVPIRLYGVVLNQVQEQLYVYRCKEYVCN